MLKDQCFHYRQEIEFPFPFNRFYFSCECVMRLYNYVKYPYIGYLELLYGYAFWKWSGGLSEPTLVRRMWFRSLFVEIGCIDFLEMYSYYLNVRGKVIGYLELSYVFFKSLVGCTNRYGAGFGMFSLAFHSKRVFARTY